MGCRWISAPLWTSMDCRSCNMCCRRIFTLVAVAPSPLLHCSGCLQSYFSHTFSLLQELLCRFFPPFLNHRAATSIPDEPGLEPHIGSFWHLLIEATPVPIHHQNLVLQAQYSGKSLLWKKFDPECLTLHPNYAVTMDELVLCHSTTSGNLSCA